MVPKLLEPPLHVLKGHCAAIGFVSFCDEMVELWFFLKLTRPRRHSALFRKNAGPDQPALPSAPALPTPPTLLRDVVDQQGTDRSPVVGARDRAVALLAGRVPDLRLDGLAVHLKSRARHARLIIHFRSNDR